jgi:acyl-coenzyme A thioesterase PaaI-like protein
MLKIPMPRRKLFTERVNLPLTADLLAKIDAALETDEVRVDFLRDAAKRELERRERAARSQDQIRDQRVELEREPRDRLILIARAVERELRRRERKPPKPRAKP